MCVACTGCVRGVCGGIPRARSYVNLGFMFVVRVLGVVWWHRWLFVTMCACMHGHGWE